ncbi:hypothetical protein BGZ76_003294 [Entomortierella beljakovae]|nr:hypothetical protein BGZ76_003294 [Entomortierella beljakovae]
MTTQLVSTHAQDSRNVFEILEDLQDYWTLPIISLPMSKRNSAYTNTRKFFDEYFHQLNLNIEDEFSIAQYEANETSILSADTTDHSAQFKTGCIYVAGYNIVNDNSKAMEWFLKAANQGNTQAQLNIGLLYYRAYGVMKDYTKAMEWYLKSASQGNILSYVLIGDLYRDGHGVSRNFSSSLMWYSKASNSGIACARISYLYYYGRGLNRDYGQGLDRDDLKAREWFIKAADHGEKLAQRIIDVIGRDTDVIQIDNSKLIEWYLKCISGKTEIRESAGDLARYGYSIVKPENRTAFSYYIRSHGPGALRSVGEFFLEGCFVNQDFNKAMYYFLKAEEEGDVQALYNIGYMYENGHGVPQDISEARKWYIRARDEGHTEARKKLE